MMTSRPANRVKLLTDLVCFLGRKNRLAAGKILDIGSPNYYNRHPQSSTSLAATARKPSPSMAWESRRLALVCSFTRTAWEAGTLLSPSSDVLRLAWPDLVAQLNHRPLGNRKAVPEDVHVLEGQFGNGSRYLHQANPLFASL